MKKDEDILIPEALRERDFRAFPAHEEKRPGPKFGTNVGKKRSDHFIKSSSECELGSTWNQSSLAKKTNLLCWLHGFLKETMN